MFLYLFDNICMSRNSRSFLYTQYICIQYLSLNVIRQSLHSESKIFTIYFKLYKMFQRNIFFFNF